jgi:tRNA A37 threonylcarbamoyladenosine modification protein TsaB
MRTCKRFISASIGRVQAAIPKQLLPNDFTTCLRLQSLSRLLIAAGLAPGSRFGAGYGWQRYPELLVANRDRVSNVVDILHPHATDLLGLATIALENGGSVEPQNIAPAYLRHKVAEKPGRAP